METSKLKKFAQQARRLLLEQVKAFQENGTVLRHDEYPLNELFSCGTVGDRNKTWQEAIPLNPVYALQAGGKRKVDLTIETETAKG